MSYITSHPFQVLLFATVLLNFLQRYEKTKRTTTLETTYQIAGTHFDFRSDSDGAESFSSPGPTHEDVVAMVQFLYSFTLALELDTHIFSCMQVLFYRNESFTVSYSFTVSSEQYVRVA